MSDQHFFAKCVMVGPRNHFRGNTGQIAVTAPIFAGKDKGHEARLGLDNFQAELTRQIVPEGRRTHFWNRKSAGRNHQGGRSKFVGRSAHDKLRGALHFLNAAPYKYLHFGLTALSFKQVDDVLRGTVAKELPKRFFVVGNAMLLD
jgi:hypothetical protein